MRSIPSTRTSASTTQAEREALAELRAGDVGSAIEFYAATGRVVTAPARDAALAAMVEAWSADVGQGRDTAMFAWRRANVAELNRLARESMAAEKRISGPELAAPGGARYAAGDRIVTLAPGADGKVVTSERGMVFLVDPEAQRLVARMDDGREQVFEHEEQLGNRSWPTAMRPPSTGAKGRPVSAPTSTRTVAVGSWPTWP